MKKFYSGISTLICFSFLFVLDSCTTDSSIVSSDTPERIGSNKEILYYNSKKANEMPTNTENPYDSDGRMYYELFKNYGSDGLQDARSSVSSPVASLACTKTSFNKMQKKDNNSATVAKGANVISANTISFSDIISNSNMTAAGKLSLIDFIHSFLFLFKQENSYAVLYDFVVQYETSILIDPILTETDRQIILTTASFARHSTYETRTESTAIIDPDWRILVGHLIGDIETIE
ncbi:hypothetical protein [Flavobacterium yafengii]|uniref:hypothetical protein n=1 Tax=Flavobacterium yafengii TaxID=3041253 RepID=UPI0024A9CB7F|nr:hypothetical protein [Flavobacterium yafengii]MDI5887408.1 hypothetical protein [Flavobacterium yafengii]